MRTPSPPPLNERPRTTRDGGEGRTQRLLDEVVRWGVLFRTHRPDHAEAQSIVPPQVSFDSMPESSFTDEQLIHEFISIIAKSTNLRSRDFLGFPDVTMCPAAVGAALLIPVLNQNMANLETCPPEATFVEMEVIHWLREALGYPVLGAYTKAMDAGGVFTSGGCLSNFCCAFGCDGKAFPRITLKWYPSAAEQDPCLGTRNSRESLNTLSREHDVPWREEYRTRSR